MRDSGGRTLPARMRKMPNFSSTAHCVTIFVSRTRRKAGQREQDSSGGNRLNPQREPSHIPHHNPSAQPMAMNFRPHILNGTEHITFPVNTPLDDVRSDLIADGTRNVSVLRILSSNMFANPWKLGLSPGTSPPAPKPAYSRMRFRLSVVA